jgi:hypothetical protein
LCGEIGVSGPIQKNYADAMKVPDKLNRLLRVPGLTRVRIVLALAIAVVADGLQFLFGLVPFVDQAIDVVGMVLTSWVLGFHWLLLPTFVVKLVPLLDELPTWTACVVAVIALRKREQRILPTERSATEI